MKTFFSTSGPVSGEVKEESDFHPDRKQQCIFLNAVFRQVVTE